MESQKNDFGWRIGNRLFAHPTFPFGVGNKRSGKPAWWPPIKFEGKRAITRVKLIRTAFYRTTAIALTGETI